MQNGLLNQHQTNSSGGIKDTGFRLKREREWTELKLSTKNKKESDILSKLSINNTDFLQLSSNQGFNIGQHGPQQIPWIQTSFHPILSIAFLKKQY
jgi:hypothetical protein